MSPFRVTVLARWALERRSRATHIIFECIKREKQCSTNIVYSGAVGLNIVIFPHLTSNRNKNYPCKSETRGGILGDFELSLKLRGITLNRMADLRLDVLFTINMDSESAPTRIFSAFPKLWPDWR